MASGIYNRLKANVLNKVIDLEADTIKVMLLDNGYTFDPDHDVIADVSSDQITGTGYTSGGVTLASKSVTQDDTNNLAKFDAADAEWTSATFTARYAVVYDDTVSGDPLICCIDFGSDKTVTGGTFTIQWNSSGILTLT
jgi:hypothetical protein